MIGTYDNDREGGEVGRYTVHVHHRAEGAVCWADIADPEVRMLGIADWGFEAL